MGEKLPVCLEDKRRGELAKSMEERDDSLDLPSSMEGWMDRASTPASPRQPRPPTRFDVVFHLEQGEPVAEVLETPPVIALHPEVIGHLGRLLRRSARPPEAEE